MSSIRLSEIPPAHYKILTSTNIQGHMKSKNWIKNRNNDEKRGKKISIRYLLTKYVRKFKQTFAKMDKNQSVGPLRDTFIYKIT